MTKFAFIGEEPSDRARSMRVGWEDGRLAAKSLFDALRANGLDPSHHHYLNWFTQDRDESIGLATTLRGSGFVLVAMGNKVSTAMARAGIAHLKIVHPAARGAIRKKETYAAHVGEILAGKKGEDK